jgi:hypothetical protein
VTCLTYAATRHPWVVEPRGIGSSAQGRLITTCAVVLQQYSWEMVAVRYHQTAAEDAGDWVRKGGVGSRHYWVEYDNQLVGATRSISGNVFWQTVAGSGQHRQQQK